MPDEIYRRFVVSALLGIAVLSTASALILSGEAPRNTGFSPEDVRTTIVTIMAAFGVLIPLALALDQRVRTRARLLVPLGCVGAGMSHAISLAGPVELPHQLTSSLAMFLSGAVFITAGIVLMEDHDEKQVHNTMAR